MEPHGFIRTKLDVKILILVVAARVEYPIDQATLYDLCYQDDAMSYFDFVQGLPELVETGHLTLDDQRCYTITAKGREHEELMADSIAFSVRCRAADAVEAYNLKRRRGDLIRAEIAPLPNSEYLIRMQLDYEQGQLMSLELTAPTEKQAGRLADAFRANAEAVYQSVLTQLIGYFEKKSD